MRSPKPSTLMHLALAALAGLAGCRKAAGERPVPHVAATNSYLACAAREFLHGDDVVALASPGVCPGHFDLKPSQADALRQATLLLRFDFQAKLDERLAEARHQRLRIVSVAAGDGLCIPATYLRACQQTADAMVEAALLDRAAAAERLRAVQRRMENLEKELTRAVRGAGLAGAPVLASAHQAAFCRDLGLHVVGTFPGADTARLSQIRQCLANGRRARARSVIGNLQEGTAVAERLGKQLGAAVVLFSNFPNMTAGQRTFDALVRANLAGLLGSAAVVRDAARG